MSSSSSSDRHSRGSAERSSRGHDDRKGKDRKRSRSRSRDHYSAVSKQLNDLDGAMQTGFKGATDFFHALIEKVDALTERFPKRQRVDDEPQEEEEPRIPQQDLAVAAAVAAVVAPAAPALDETVLHGLVNAAAASSADARASQTEATRSATEAKESSDHASADAASAQACRLAVDHHAAIVQKLSEQVAADAKVALDAVALIPKASPAAEGNSKTVKQVLDVVKPQIKEKLEKIDSRLDGFASDLQHKVKDSAWHQGQIGALDNRVKELESKGQFDEFMKEVTAASSAATLAAQEAAKVSTGLAQAMQAAANAEASARFAADSAKTAMAAKDHNDVAAMEVDAGINKRFTDIETKLELQAGKLRTVHAENKALVQKNAELLALVQAQATAGSQLYAYANALCDQMSIDYVKGAENRLEMMDKLNSQLAILVDGIGNTYDIEREATQFTAAANEHLCGELKIAVTKRVAEAWKPKLNAFIAKGVPGASARLEAMHAGELGAMFRGDGKLGGDGPRLTPMATDPFQPLHQEQEESL